MVGQFNHDIKEKTKKLSSILSVRVKLDTVNFRVSV